MKLTNKVRQGFSLAELIMTVSISSFVVITVISSCFLLHKSMHRLITKSQALLETAGFIEEVHYDVLNSDVFPARPADDYALEENRLSFFSGGRKVVYSFSEGQFVIAREVIKEPLEITPEMLLEGIENIDDVDSGAREEALKKLMGQAKEDKAFGADGNALMEQSELMPGEEDEEPVEMEEQSYDFITSCEFEYLDINESVVLDDEFPYFCLLKLTFKDNRTIEYKVKL